MSWEEAQITFVADGAFASYCCVTNHPTPALADHACLAHYSRQLVGWLGPTGLGGFTHINWLLSAAIGVTEPPILQQASLGLVS